MNHLQDCPALSFCPCFSGPDNLTSVLLCIESPQTPDHTFFFLTRLLFKNIYLLKDNYFTIL